MKAAPEIQRVTIRRAVAHDAVNIMRLLEVSVTENDVGYPEVHPQKLLNWIVHCLETACIMCADCSGRLVGCMGLRVQVWPWADESFLSTEFLFVRPEFRPRGTAEALIRSAEKFADQAKLRLIVSFSGGKDSVLKDRLMGMRGYIYAGGSFHRLPK